MAVSAAITLVVGAKLLSDDRYRDSGLWIIFVGIVVALGSGFCHWQSWLWQQKPATETSLKVSKKAAERNDNKGKGAKNETKANFAKHEQAAPVDCTDGPTKENKHPAAGDQTASDHSADKLPFPANLWGLPIDRKIELFFALCIVLFTFGQVIVGQRQWDATQKQYDAMVDELVGAEFERRPWIGVANPKLTEPPTTAHVKLTVDITNYGKSPALIDEFSGQFISSPSDPPPGFIVPSLAEILERLKKHAKRNINAITIEPGETIPLPMSLDGPKEGEMDRFFGAQDDRFTLFFFRFKYRGAFMDVEDETPLRCFKYNRKTKQLEVHPNFNWDRLGEPDSEKEAAENHDRRRD